MKIPVKLTEEQRKLVEANVLLVPYTVDKCRKDFDFERDEMISIGYIGLCRAAFSYDSKRKNKFSTYAVKCISNEIGREYIGAKRKKRGYGRVVVSLNEMAGDSDGNSVSDNSEKVGNIIDESIDVENTAIDRAFCSTLWKFVPTFVAVDKVGLSDREYGLRHGLSTGTIHAKKKRELERVRKYLATKGIRRYADLY